MTGEPNLGCATTRELLSECAVRFEIQGETPEEKRALDALDLMLAELPDRVLAYRTVDAR